MSFMITRDNYEEFFLLYVDNELSATERQLVESWVAENPDLTEEWELLVQCRIMPDRHLVFTDRESLFRQEQDRTANTSPAGLVTSNDSQPISTDNYEEYFLSYIDGELDVDARKSVDEFVLRHPALHAELSSLQQTVSVPDPAIVFENKEILYRKEKERRIVFFPWRIAAAALVAGVIGLLIFNSLKKAPGGSLAGSPLPDHLMTIPDTNQSTAPAHIERIAQAEAAGNPTGKTAVAKKTGPAVTPRSSSTLHLTETGQRGAVAGQQPSLTIGKQEEDPGDKALAQTEGLTPVKTRGIEQQPIQVITPGTDGPADRTLALATPVAAHPYTQTKENSFATQALQSSSGSSPDDGLAMEDAPSKKNKLRGLFRKVTRVLEKSTSREDDDHRSVLVGSFQFALK